jgi:hypothetical protein
MWFYYLLSAIGVSVGTGALVAYDSEQQIASVINASEPETHAENTARISRALRRLHQMNPSAFPSVRGNGSARIPDSLLEAATMGGLHLPRDVIFEIDSTGKVASRVALDTSMNVDRFVGTIDREGLDENMNRVERNLGAIRNPDPYDFYATPNFEGVLPGEEIDLTDGGIDNTKSHRYKRSLLGELEGVEYVYYNRSTDTGNKKLAGGGKHLKEYKKASIERIAKKVQFPRTGYEYQRDNHVFNNFDR